MKNYYDFRKSVNKKLQSILEEKVERLCLPQNAFGYTASNGYYNVTPFGTKTYIISVVLPNRETYDDFYEEFYGDEDTYFSDINWKKDNVYGYYGVDLYVPEGNLEAGQAKVKDILEAIKEQ